MRISDWSSDVCSSDLNFIHQFASKPANWWIKLASTTNPLVSSTEARTHGSAFSRFLQENPLLLSRRLFSFESGLGWRVAAFLIALCVVAPLLTLCWYRSEEHTSELQSLMRISYAVFCLKKKNN